MGDHVSRLLVVFACCRMADFYNNDAHSLLPLYYLSRASGGNEPIPDAIMVNGEFTRKLHFAVSRTSATRFRLICTAAFSMFNFSVDGGNVAVVELDGSEVIPYPVEYVLLNVAQV